MILQSVDIRPHVPVDIIRADECVVIEEIIIHLSRFLKNDQASGDTFYYKVVHLK